MSDPQSKPKVSVSTSSVPFETKRVYSNQTITFFTLIYTVALIAFRRSFHRLSFPATFDDVNYFIDGAERLTVLWKNGLIPFLRDLTTKPPHPPGGTLLSLAALSVFGFNDFAGYAVNFVKHHALDYDLFCRFSRRYRFHKVDGLWNTYRMNAVSKSAQRTEAEVLDLSVQVPLRRPPAFTPTLRNESRIQFASTILDHVL